MLALIAGTGDLPTQLVQHATPRPLICALAGFEPALAPDLAFRLEHLGSFLAELKARGVTRICMAGAVTRPVIDPAAIDDATKPLIPLLQSAMSKGDDGALRGIIALLEDQGFAIVAAHQIAPALLPEPGVLTQAQPQPPHEDDAARGQECVAAMGVADVGQACLIRAAAPVATEGQDGTDAMLDRFILPQTPDPTGDVLDTVTDVASDMFDTVADWLVGPAVDRPDAGGAILFKAPKPGQDRRADLPVIGPGTARRAARAGLAGIVVEAGGVMVLHRADVVQALDAAGLFLWVRPRGDT
ncbi:UDP-2,3-diacylglucosamine diphosphatase LpxI domain-containing protein [Yoonia sp. SS1-5]|uniref:LpxI family protein n=1 Tax=Yoonia rhodophyticola TaxID=3137370 RepID=A0AAN0NJR4_9RHOB